jgi:23S rRNA-/tRNA-specific pseudouridylate synthase
VDAVLSDLKFDLRHPPMTVHRLDRDTTGCLILARTHEAQRTLAGYFQDRARAFSARDDSARTLGDIRRVYWALVSANKSTLAPCGTVDAPLVTTHAGVTLKPGADAKPAATDYEIIAESNVEPTGTGRSPVVLALRPRTGRKHQLRVHCAGVLDAAIVGDYKYGYKDVSRTGRIADDWRRTLRDVDADARMNDPVRAERVRRGSGSDETCLEGVPLHLHAREVEFLHPTSGKMVRVVAPVPPHVSAAFQALSLALDNG